MKQIFLSLYYRTWHSNDEQFLNTVVISVCQYPTNQETFNALLAAAKAITKRKDPSCKTKNSKRS